MPLTLLLAGCGERHGEASAADRTLRIALNSEPTLEPGFATDLGHATIAHGLLDPLVRLDANLRAVPGLAKSWDFSADGLTITFHLRGDGRWTNGDPVTARDFEFSWKRTLSPELGAANGYYLYGIAGAEAYSNCDGIRRRVCRPC